MKTWEANVVREQLQSLDDSMKPLEHEVLARASAIQGREMNIHKFHGIIGSKNNDYADIYRARFFDPEDFVAKWLQGLLRRAKADEVAAIQKYGEIRYPSAALRMVELVKDAKIREYTLLFLRRNFYRQLAARVRNKPDERLWSLWFGNNQLTWGLLIAGSYWQNEWRSRAHKIRHADYTYWSIGHVLEEGLMVPGDPQRLQFSTIADFVQFYRQVLTRISNSAYERGIADLYANYVQTSNDPASEPFLIPELRYAGIAREHLYRVDYSVFNAHIMQFVGFELSPHSTHMAVKGMAAQTQAAVNAKLASQWEKEMDKRNRYFEQFDLPIITFTDSQLTDLPACFSVMAGYLSARPEQPVTVADQVRAIESF